MKHNLQRLAVLASGLGASALSSAVAIVDYSSAGTTALAEITATAASGMALFGAVLAVGIGIRLIKKFAKG